MKNKVLGAVLIAAAATTQPAFGAHAIDLKAELSALRGDPRPVIDLNRATIVSSATARTWPRGSSVHCP